MTMEQDVRILSQVPLFAQLESEALRLLAFTAEKLSLDENEVLFRIGEASECSYLITSGCILLNGGDFDSSTGVKLSSPALIGETALIVLTTRPGNATAIEPSTLLKIPRQLFLRIMREFPDGAARLREFMAHRLAQFTGELDVARQRAESRAAE